jgi:hypothetical protein
MTAGSWESQLKTVDFWPLLDIRDAVKECDSTLADIIAEVGILQQESEGHHPPAAAQFLANVIALREMLTELFPPALQQAIADEQTVYDEDTARWEPTNY